MAWGEGGTCGRMRSLHARVSRANLAVGPHLFFFVIVVAMVAGYATHLSRNGIFACPATLYGGDNFLGFCPATAYGNFDHAAFWFSLEPRANEHAAAADVLFLGNSRLQMAFSTPSLGRWFNSVNRRYYLLGFGYAENLTFTAALLRKLNPRARVYVINVDDFFVDAESGAGREVMHDPSARSRMLTKQVWQIPHRLICGAVPAICGNRATLFRNRSTGEWRLAGIPPWLNFRNMDLGIEYSELERALPVARKFLSETHIDRRCIILTYVWTPYNRRATAKALATELDLPFFSPELGGLQTYDSSHLTEESSERFVSAFLEQAAPRLARCLNLGPSFSNGNPLHTE